MTGCKEGRRRTRTKPAGARLLPAAREDSPGHFESRSSGDRRRLTSSRRLSHPPRARAATRLGSTSERVRARPDEPLRGPAPAACRPRKAGVTAQRTWDRVGKRPHSSLTRPSSINLCINSHNLYPRRSGGRTHQAARLEPNRPRHVPGPHSAPVPTGEAHRQDLRSEGRRDPLAGRAEVEGDDRRLHRPAGVRDAVPRAGDDVGANASGEARPEDARTVRVGDESAPAAGIRIDADREADASSLQGVVRRARRDRRHRSQDPDCPLLDPERGRRAGRASGEPRRAAPARDASTPRHDHPHGGGGPRRRPGDRAAQRPPPTSRRTPACARASCGRCGVATSTCRGAGSPSSGR